MQPGHLPHEVELTRPRVPLRVREQLRSLLGEQNAKLIEHLGGGLDPKVPGAPPDVPAHSTRSGGEGSCPSHGSDLSTATSGNWSGGP